MLLSDFEPEELEEGNDTKDSVVTLSSNLLSYRYDSNLEDVETYRSLGSEEDFADLDDDERLRVSDLALRIIEDILPRYSPRSQSSVQPNVELAEAARSAKTILTKLEDHTRSYEKEELQKMMEKRNELEDVLTKKREAGRDDYLLDRREKHLAAMKQELNIRYD